MQDNKLLFPVWIHSDSKQYFPLFTSLWISCAVLVVWFSPSRFYLCLLMSHRSAGKWSESCQVQGGFIHVCSSWLSVVMAESLPSSKKPICSVLTRWQIFKREREQISTRLPELSFNLEWRHFPSIPPSDHITKLVQIIPLDEKTCKGTLKRCACRKGKDLCLHFQYT